jgi:hypothetical protein
MKLVVEVINRPIVASFEFKGVEYPNPTEATMHKSAKSKGSMQSKDTRGNSKDQPESNREGGS